ncbi:hypothetical protein J2129_001544 [Methanofollis sp. W23]|uniref:DUF6141 family protein n=1 Tax=Methanofollis sp. W23 TaxID=2817849 RepID=UPI001AE27C35|nr:hypothetical protein [Methanofollis sp. W23]
MTEVRYREVQHFTSPWLWGLLIFIAGLIWWGAVQQLVLGIPFGNNPASDEGIAVVALIFGILFPLFFVVTNLTLEVRDDGIYYRFFPFHLRFRAIPWEEITRLEACTYRPFAEFGGWGIRWGGLRQRGYSTGGNRGVRVYRRDGEMVLLGTCDPAALVAAVNAEMK